MDGKNLKDIGGMVSKIALTVSRKLSDGDYGSFEVSGMLEMDLAPGTDPIEAFDALDATLTAKVAQSIREKEANLPQKAPQQAPAAPVAQGPPTPSQPPLPGESPPGPAGDGFTEIENPAFAHAVTSNGQDFVKVFGGRGLDIWGVNMWDDVADPQGTQFSELRGWRDWPLCKSSKSGFEKENRYSIQGVSVAVVQMRNKDGKIVPDKVVGLR